MKTASGLAISNDITFSFLDAIYDCASLYTKNYKISGEYKLPADVFLGTPEINVSDNPGTTKKVLHSQIPATLKSLYNGRSSVTWRAMVVAGRSSRDARWA